MQTDKANEHEKGEPRVGRDVSPILQENNGTEKRRTSSNLHLVQCLVPWPQVPGSPSLNREPLPNHLSFKAVKNYTAYLWNMAINKHSSHRHIVLWIVLWVHTDRALTKTDLKKACFPAIWTDFTTASESFCTEHSSSQHNRPQVSIRFLHNTHCLLCKSLTDKTSVPPEPEKHISSKLSMWA